MHSKYQQSQVTFQFVKQLSTTFPSFIHRIHHYCVNNQPQFDIHQHLITSSTTLRFFLHWPTITTKLSSFLMCYWGSNQRNWNQAKVLFNSSQPARHIYSLLPAPQTTRHDFNTLIPVDDGVWPLSTAIKLMKSWQEVAGRILQLFPELWLEMQTNFVYWTRTNTIVKSLRHRNKYLLKWNETEKTC